MDKKGVSSICAFSLDSVAEWFLRLNGFFTVPNFVVHPVHANEGTRQRTDADVLGVRFPYRKEIVGSEALADHPAFQSLLQPMLAIAEVKTGMCRLNGPWTRKDGDNIGNVLRAVGCFPLSSVAEVSESLYQRALFHSPEFEVRLLCFGAQRSHCIADGALQVTWDEVFRFVHSRYQTFWRFKCQHQQWPRVGQFLWDQSENREEEEYVTEMLRAFRVRA